MCEKSKPTTFSYYEIFSSAGLVPVLQAHLLTLVVTDERINELHPRPQICNWNHSDFSPPPQLCNQASFTFRLWSQNQNSCGVLWRFCNCAQTIWKLAICNPVLYEQMIYRVQPYLGQGSGDWRPKKWNTSSKLWVNFDWVAECEYLIREAKCWQTCLADMPTTKYKLWSKQGLIWNTFWIIAISKLNVLVWNILRSTLFCSAHKWPLVFKKKALTIRCLHKQSNWMAEVPKSCNVQVFGTRSTRVAAP